MYRRPFYENPKEQHPIEKQFGHHGQLTAHLDVGWIRHEIDDLMMDGTFALHQISKTLEHIKGLDLSVYKEEIAAQKKTEIIRKSRQTLLAFAKKHIEAADQRVKNISGYILSLTEPKTPSDPVKAMLQEMKWQEIRSIIRTIEPKHRADFIRQDPENMRAAVNSPDRLIPDDRLTEIRREYAFQYDPSLRNEEEDTIAIYQATRKRAAEINSTSIAMMIKEGIDDPLSAKEHYEIFPPQNDHEAALAKRRIQSEERAAELAENKRLFEEKNKGINFEIQDRRQRARARRI